MSKPKITVTVAHYNRAIQARNKLLEQNERLTKSLRAMRKHFIMRRQTITDLRKDHHIDCAQQVGWSIGCNCFMAELMAEVDAALGITVKQAG